jgi:hypothetical protein
MNPSRLQFIVLYSSHATFLVRHRLAVIVQLDIARLEALYIALFGLRLRAHEAAHRQCRAGGRVRSLSFRTGDELGLSTKADLARRLVPRSFPKVKSVRVV